MYKRQEQLGKETAILEAQIATLEQRIGEAISIQAHFAVEVKEAGHQLRSLRMSLAVLLDEVERLFPVAGVSDAGHAEGAA